jgi:hypothetical protein
MKPATCTNISINHAEQNAAINADHMNLQKKKNLEYLSGSAVFNDVLDVPGVFAGGLWVVFSVGATVGVRI